MINQTVTSITKNNPHPKLVKLIKKNCDGGYGEFDKYLPKECLKYCRRDGATYFPRLSGKNVIWDIQ